MTIRQGPPDAPSDTGARPGGTRPGRAAVGDITAVLLAHPGTPSGSLPDLLDAVAAQSRRPQRVLICGLDPQEHELVEEWSGIPVSHRPVLPVLSAEAEAGEPALWRVLDDARAALPITADHWLWLLHDDSLPEPLVLESLTAAVRRTSRVGMVGPKLVRADDPRLLVGVGQHITAAGRAADQREMALVDQGQLDLRQDVLGTPVAGALIRSDVFDAVGGLDAGFGSDGVEGLDLGWRIHLYGERVVVAPDAVVHQGAAGLGVTHPRRTRMRLRQMALARSSLGASLGRRAGIILTSSLAALLLLLVKRTHEAADEWADVRAALSPLRGWRARWRFRTRRQVRSRDLAVLFVPRSSGLRSTVETIGEALDPRSREPARNRTHPPEPTRHGAEPGPVSDEFAELADPAPRGSRWSWPLLVAALTTVLLTAVHWWPLLGALRPGSTGVAGGQLGSASTDATGLWRSAMDGWRGGGLGHGGSAEAWLLPASALTWVVEHLPGGPTGTATAGVALGLILLLAAPASVVTAYLALRRATRRRWLRGLLALGWAGALPLTAGIASGRVGPVVVHVLAPLLVAGYAVASAASSSVRRTAATFATALGVALAAQWVPLVLVPATLAGLLLLVLGRSRARLRGLVLAVLPWVLMLPWLLSLPSSPGQLLGGAGATVASQGLPLAAPAWQLLLLNPADPVAPASWAALPLWLAVPVWLAALGALLLPGGGGRRAGVLVGGALLTLGLALVAPRVGIGLLPADHAEAGATVTAWVGTLLSLTAAGLLLAATLLLDHLLAGRHPGASDAGEAPDKPVPAMSSPLVGTTLVWMVCGALSVAACAALGWSLVAPQLEVPGSMTTQLAPAVAPMPAVAGEQARGPLGVRTLVLEPVATPADGDGDGDDLVAAGEQAFQLTADLVGVEPEPARILPDLTRDLAATPTALDDPVSAAVAALTGETTPADAVDQLRTLGVGYVEVLAVEQDPLVRLVDRLPGMTRVSSPQGQALWRMLDHEHARVQVLDGQGSLVDHLPVTGPHGAAAGRLQELPAGATLRVSEGGGWASQATVRVDDEPVTLQADGTAALPAGSHEVTVVVGTPGLPWHLIALAIAVVTAFLALPFGRTETEEEAGR